LQEVYFLGMAVYEPGSLKLFAGTSFTYTSVLQTDPCDAPVAMSCIAGGELFDKRGFSSCRFEENYNLLNVTVVLVMQPHPVVQHP
jgi:hypothetical protein